MKIEARSGRRANILLKTRKEFQLQREFGRGDCRSVRKFEVERVRKLVDGRDG